MVSNLLAYFPGSQLYEYGLEYNKMRHGLQSNGAGVGAFLGYIGAINDMAVQHFYCLPNNVEGSTIADVVFKYLDEHPEKRTSMASVLVVNALKEAYPCKRK